MPIPSGRACRRAAAPRISRRPARRPPCPGSRRACRSRSTQAMLPNHSSNGGKREAAGHRRPADQRAPGEDEAEPRLRPPGDPLHERIGGDRREADERDQRRDPVELEQHDAGRSGTAARSAAQAERSDTRPLASGRRRVRSTWRRDRGRRCRCRRSRRCASRMRRAPATGTGPSARRRPPARRSTRTASRAASCRSAGRAASARRRAAAAAASAPMKPRRSLSGTMSVVASRGIERRSR